MSILNLETLKRNGCVLWWSGTVATSGTYDDDGNKQGFLILPDGVTVTPSGTFTTVKGKDGITYLKFDGSTNYVSLSNHANFDIGVSNSPFTICGWVKLNSDDHMIICRGGGFDAFNSTTGYQYLLDLFPASNAYWQWWTGSAQGAIAFSPSLLVTGTWKFLTIVYDGTTTTIYVDLVFVVSATSTYVKPSSSQYTRVGASVRQSQLDYPTNGNIKDLMIFKGKALDTNQIGAIMEETYIY
ncbi:MAG: LamG domain-containing protein [Methanothrix sp.]|nr:LamG domain-containing protein [Methanothrix sp.]